MITRYGITRCEEVGDSPRWQFDVNNNDGAWVKFRDYQIRVDELAGYVPTTSATSPLTRFCEDCRFIIKPTGAPYIPHPDSICGTRYIKSKGFVVRELEKEHCKDVNTDGMCPYFKRLGEK